MRTSFATSDKPLTKHLLGRSVDYANRQVTPPDLNNSQKGVTVKERYVHTFSNKRKKHEAAVLGVSFPRV